jgi:hypothetical protein
MANQENQNLKSLLDSFMQAVRPITERRAKRFQNLMGFVLDGQQWTASEVKERNGDETYTFNFSEDFVERFMARLFPRNPRTGVIEIGAKVYESDKDLKNKYNEAIMDCYAENSFITTLLEQGINYLVGGSSCFYFPKDPITKKIKIISLDPQMVYLGWRGNTLVQFAYDEYLGISASDVNSVPQVTILGKKRTTYWDLENVCVFENGEIVKQWKNEDGEIPFAWIPCMPKPRSHEGRSKIESLYDLDRAYNLAASDYAKRNAENTNPERVIFSDSLGAKDSDKFTRGRKQTHFLGKEDDMRNLELTSGQEVLDFLKMLDDRMKQKTGIVSSAGSVRAQVSGLSLASQYSDMLDLIGFMRIFWDEAFRKMNSAILQSHFTIGNFRTDPVYQSFIIQDSKAKVDEYGAMLDKDLISHRDAIDELRGVENADDKVQEILAEKKLFNSVLPPSNNQGNNFLNKK